MSKVLLQQFAGNGCVWAGKSRISEVQYDIAVYRLHDDSMTFSGSSSTPHLKRIELDLPNCKPPLAVDPEELTLELDDGHKLNFVVIATNTYRARGGIY